MNLNTKAEIKAFLKAQSKKSSSKNVIDAEEIDHKKRMIMYRFLSEVERVTEEKRLSRKELAKLIGTSASYITQLYRGSKIINLETLAKLEYALKVSFDISAKSNDNIDFAGFIAENNFGIENSLKLNLLAQNVTAESKNVDQSNGLQMVDLDELITNTTEQEYEEKYC